MNIDRIQKAAAKANEFWDEKEKAIDVVDLEKWFTEITIQFHVARFRTLMNEKFPRDFSSAEYEYTKQTTLKFIKDQLKTKEGPILLDSFRREYSEMQKWVDSIRETFSNQDKEITNKVFKYIKRFIETDRNLKWFTDLEETRNDSPKVWLLMVLGRLSFSALRRVRRFLDALLLNKPEMLYGPTIMFPTDEYGFHDAVCYTQKMFGRAFQSYVTLIQNHQQIYIYLSNVAPKGQTKWQFTFEDGDKKWMVDYSPYLMERIKDVETQFVAIPVFIQKITEFGHGAIVVYDRTNDVVEVFDSAGSLNNKVYQKVLESIFETPKSIIFVNDKQLQFKTSYLEKDEFCQTYIYWFLYQRTVLGKPSKVIVHHLSEELTIDQRFSLMRSFGAYVQNLDNNKKQVIRPKKESKQIWVKWFEKMQAMMDTPLLPFLVKNDLIDKEEIMQLRKCITLEVPLDQLSTSADLTELLMCYIDGLSQERFKKIQGLLNWYSWLKVNASVRVPFASFLLNLPLSSTYTLPDLSLFFWEKDPDMKQTLPEWESFMTWRNEVLEILGSLPKKAKTELVKKIKKEMKEQKKNMTSKSKKKKQQKTNITSKSRVLSKVTTPVFESKTFKSLEEVLNSPETIDYQETNNQKNQMAVLLLRSQITVWLKKLSLGRRHRKQRQLKEK